MKRHDRKHRNEKTIGKGRRPPSLETMASLLLACGLRLSPSQLKQLWTYHQLLRRHDDRLNLTRIRNFENMVEKLYADSMLPALHTRLPSPLLDLGSGPGMPGVPLKIFRPEIHVLLAESRQNRCDFLKEVVAQLGLEGLEVIDRGIAPDFDRAVAGVITRAVEPMADTLARVEGCLAVGGRVIFMKGPGCDQELQTARQRFQASHDLVEDTPYRIPHTPHRRRLVVFRKHTAVEPESAAKDLTVPQRVRIIESEENPRFKELKKLLGGRGVKKQEKTIVFGRRLVDEVLERHPGRCLAWIGSGDRDSPPNQAPDHVHWIQLAPELFRTIDAFGTRAPMLLVKAPAPQSWPTEVEPTAGCTLLVPFQDPENVGAVIRTAVAFDVARIVLLAESANPFHPKAVRASAGTVFAARLFQGPSLSEIPPNLPVIALAATGSPLAQTRFPQAFCLLAGLEGPGLPPAWQAGAVAIPMNPAVESLNAAVATAIALYEWRRQ